MEKGKKCLWRASFAAEVDRQDGHRVPFVSAKRSSRSRQVPLRRTSVSARRPPFLAKAVLLAALAATGSPAALAEQGGRAHNQAIPNVNLGVTELQRAGAAPFVPSAAPRAAQLTPSNGLPPPGHLDTPGLRLGVGRSAGSPPGSIGTPGALPSQNAMPSQQPGNGLAVGKSGEQPRPGTADVFRGPEAEAGRTGSGADTSASEQTGSGESLPRQLPTCR